MFEDLILALDQRLCTQNVLRSAWDMPTIEYAIAFAKKSLNDRNKQVKCKNEIFKHRIYLT